VFPVVAVVVTFENPAAVKTVVSYMPIFVTFEGANTTFPVGMRRPPANKLAFWAAIGPTFAMVSVVGLRTPILAELNGTNTTFPVGERTPP
jgi:hypothetical protein